MIGAALAPAHAHCFQLPGRNESAQGGPWKKAVKTFIEARGRGILFCADRAVVTMHMLDTEMMIGNAHHQYVRNETLKPIYPMCELVREDNADRT